MSKVILLAPLTRSIQRKGVFPPVDASVDRLEDEYVARRSTLGTGMSSLALKENFPSRPAYGTKGRRVVLWANYFNLTPAKDLYLHRYHVSVTPQAKGRKLRRVFQILLENPLLANKSATDFKSLLVSRVKLDNLNLDLKYRAELEDEPLTDSSTYNVVVSHTGALNIGELFGKLGSLDAAGLDLGSEQTQEILQVLNILLGHSPQSTPDKITTIAGNRHYPFGPGGVESGLGGGLCALRGFFRSVRIGTARLLVNINVSHGAFFKPGPLQSLITEFFNSIRSENWYQAERFFKKVRVKTTHLPVKKNKSGMEIPRIKTIIGLANNNDGHGLPHPPQVGRYPASSKQVKFWYEPDSESASSSSKPATKGAPGKAGPKKGKIEAGYISVFDYYQKGKLRPCALTTCSSDIWLSSKHDSKIP